MTDKWKDRLVSWAVWLACAAPLLWFVVQGFTGDLGANPIQYVLRQLGVWALRFPSAEYEAEYAHGRRYLPDRVEIDAKTLADAGRGVRSERVQALARQCVLLDLPERYL